ncbi:MAG: PilZ protein [Candidatus Hydrogenedentes bacterium]|nr:PilZ protein [Candidatus Hydrogenedentota bacterium]
MLISHSSGYSETWTVDAIRIEGRVLDLSGGGASLFTKQSFETGQELRLTIKMREGEKISTNAVVRWVKAVPDKGAFASGVQFKEVSKSDAERIEAFLKYLDKSAGL